MKRTAPRPTPPSPERTTAEIERMGRWLDEHYDEMVTALSGIRNFWESDEIKRMTRLFGSMEEMRREQVKHWNALILSLMEAYEGEEEEDE